MNLEAEQFRNGFQSLGSKCLYWGNIGEETLLAFLKAYGVRDTVLVLQGYAQLEAKLTFPRQAHFSWKGNNNPPTDCIYAFFSFKIKVLCLQAPLKRSWASFSCLSSKSDFPQTSRKGILAPHDSWWAHDAAGFVGKGQGSPQREQPRRSSSRQPF